MTVGVGVVAMVVAMVGVGMGEVAVVDTVNENNTIISGSIHLHVRKKERKKKLQ